MKRKKMIRRKFRKAVFQRDNLTCHVCGSTRCEDELDAHHITDRSLMPNGGYVKENGITLCKDTCHLLCEEYHISGGTNWHEGLHPDDLYEMIGSSYERAREASLCST